MTKINNENQNKGGSQFWFSLSFSLKKGVLHLFFLGCGLLLSYPCYAQGFGMGLVTRGTETGRIPGLRGWVCEMTLWSGQYQKDGSKKADSVEQRCFFDPYGNVVAIERKLYDGRDYMQDTIAYRYDHRGRLLTTILMHDGDTMLAKIWEYNDTTDEVKIVMDRLNPWAYISTYQYFPDGVCVTYYSDKALAVHQDCYTGGRLVSIIGYNSYWGEPEEVLTALEYDGAGRPLVMGDVLQPDDPRQQVRYEYDPYGNMVFSARENDTVLTNYNLYDRERNWLASETYDNGWHTEWCRREIVYATDSSEFQSNMRLHDPYWKESHQTGFFEIKYPRGDYYLGDLVEGMRHGRGELQLTDGTRYEGGFYNNRYHGSGILHRQDAEITGSWQHGEIDCDHVEIRYADGRHYSGAFHPLNDSCRYSGRTIFPDGGEYNGEYALEQYDGWGRLRQGDGTKTEGWWRMGMPDGSVTIVMPNLDRHLTTFRNGIREKLCTILYINGDLYEGETDSMGLPDGYGRLTTATGRKKEGYFEQGKYRGKKKLNKQ